MLKYNNSNYFLMIIIPAVVLLVVQEIIIILPGSFIFPLQLPFTSAHEYYRTVVQKQSNYLHQRRQYDNNNNIYSPKKERSAFIVRSTQPISNNFNRNTNDCIVNTNKLRQYQNRAGGSIRYIPLNVVVSEDVISNNSNNNNNYNEQQRDRTISQEDDKITKFKEKIIEIAKRTKRGFNANSRDRAECNHLVYELAKLNPTKEPVRSYYSTTPSSNDQNSTSSLAASLQGKWTLVYTDAPDITTLDQNPLVAQLGRIGQECNPPYITNVIEYTKPSWIKNSGIPFIGGGDTKDDEIRVLQKVITKGSVDPDQPKKVILRLSGLQIVPIDSKNQYNTIDTRDLGTITKSIETVGLIETIVQINPIKFQGPFDVPFGEFEILYLDNEFRIIRTGQNYIAINTRQSSNNEWF